MYEAMYLQFLPADREVKRFGFLCATLKTLLHFYHVATAKEKIFF